MFLRQSTASQEILLGPFVDSTDGVTAETGLTIANTDIKIWKSGSTTESNKNSGGATHIASGRYYTVLDATDTDTVGMLEVNVAVSGALPVLRRFYVLEEIVYDALFGSAATGIPTAAVIADAVWDEATSGHVAAGSFGASIIVIGVSYTWTNTGSGVDSDNVTITRA